MSSDSVTGPGVPLTTAQRVARYGARTRPAVTAGVPMFELDETLEAKYRESVLIRYEDFDRDAAKVLRDRRSWVWFIGIAVVVIPAAWALFLAGIFTLSVAATWTVPAAVAIAAGLPYLRIERRKHEGIVEAAREHIQPFVNSGKARFVEE
jgi:hypothetical protein